MLIKPVWRLLVTVLVLLVITACGGGQDVPPQEEPAGDENEDSLDETNIEGQNESPAEPSTGETGTEAPATDNGGSD